MTRILLSQLTQQAFFVFVPSQLHFGVKASHIKTAVSAKKKSKTVKELDDLLKAAELAIDSQAKYITKLKNGQRTQSLDGPNNNLNNVIKKLRERCEMLVCEVEQLRLENAALRNGTKASKTKSKCMFLPISTSLVWQGRKD